MNEQDDFFPELDVHPEEPEEDNSPGLLEYIAALLEEIESNTQNFSRGIRVDASVDAKPVQNRANAESLFASPQAVAGKPSVGKTVRQSGKPVSEHVRRNLAQTAVPREQASLLSTQSGSAPPEQASESSEQGKPDKQKAERSPKKAQARRVVPDGAALPVPPAFPKAPPPPEQTGTASQQALQQRREEDSVEAESRSLSELLKKNIGGWDGSLSDAHSKDDLGDTTGLAAGGPIWGALKEVKDAIDTGNDDDTSLLGVLKKTAADKVGITAAKEKIEAKKTAAKDAILKWAGAKPANPGTEATPDNGRDEKGQFVSGGGKPSGVEKQQLELAQNSFSLATDEAREEEKRHEELTKILQKLAANASGGGGLLDGVMDDLPDFDRKKGRGGKAGKAGKPGLLRRTGNRLARAGKSAGGLLLRGGKAAVGGLAAAGGLLGAGGMLGGAGAAGATAGTVASAASAAGISGGTATAAKSTGILGKAGSVLSKAGSLGAKGLGGAIRAVPVLGQIAAAGLAVKDGIDGWNDADMQREAFGLQEGKEATTGQKASSSLASVLDLGGLLTGAAGLVGFDVNTSDIAKGIYGAAGSVADFFGFGEKDKKKAPDPKADAEEREKRLDTLVAMAQPFAAQNQPATTAVSALANDGEEKGLLADLTSALLLLKDKISEEIKEVVDSPSEASTSILSGGGGGSGGSASHSGSSSGGGSGIGFGGGIAGGGYTPSKSPAKKVDAIPVDAEIGSVIAKYESGKNGSTAIGYDRVGGTSYGKYQLSSKAGNADKFLDHLESRGGEAAAVAQRLRAAGPAETGSKGGARPDQWKKEAAANPDLFEREERAYILKENYNPAMKSLKDNGLRERINGSRTLREAMFSTAVQHGPGGAPAIWNKVYREGMSDEEFLSGVYKERATRFGSSNPKIQASARSRMERENAEMQGLLAAEKQQKAAGTGVAATPADSTAQTPQNTPPAAVAATPVTPDSAQLAEVRQAGSQAIQQNTDAAIASRVRYNMGSKSIRSGRIDCSGLVAQQTRAMMNGVNASMGQEVYGPEAKQVLAKGANGGAAGLIETIGQVTGQEMGNADLTTDKVKEGMMIGLSKGSHARDRYKGIGHVVQTYRDPVTGEMMVSESTSAGRNRGKDGVRKTPYDEWYKQNAKTAMHGVDPTLLADAERLPQTGVAATTPPQTKDGKTEESKSVTALADASQGTASPASVLATPAQTALQAESVATYNVQPAPQPREPESIAANPPVQQEPSSGADFSRVEQLLAELITTVRQQGTLQGEHTETNGDLNIPMDFSDPYLLGIAHDRA